MAKPILAKQWRTLSKKCQNLLKRENQALLAWDTSSLYTNLLSIESYRQILRCKPIFCFQIKSAALIFFITSSAIGITAIILAVYFAVWLPLSENLCLSVVWKIQRRKYNMDAKRNTCKIFLVEHVSSQTQRSSITGPITEPIFNCTEPTFIVAFLSSPHPPFIPLIMMGEVDFQKNDVSNLEESLSQGAWVISTSNFLSTANLKMLGNKEVWQKIQQRFWREVKHYERKYPWSLSCRTRLLPFFRSWRDDWNILWKRVVNRKGSTCYKLLLGVEENFMQSLSAFLFFGGKKE